MPNPFIFPARQPSARYLSRGLLLNAEALLHHGHAGLGGHDEVRAPAVELLLDASHGLAGVPLGGVLVHAGRGLGRVVGAGLGHHRPVRARRDPTDFAFARPENLKVFRLYRLLGSELNCTLLPPCLLLWRNALFPFTHAQMTSSAGATIVLESPFLASSLALPM